MPRRQAFFFFVPGFQLISALVATMAASVLAYGHGGHAHATASKPTPEEIAAFERAKPVFEHHCFRCHTTSGKKSGPKALEHISMDGYPFGGHHAGEAGAAVRKVLGADGKPKATMPSDAKGTVIGDDLAKIVAWANAFDRGRANQPAGPSTAPRSD